MAVGTNELVVALPVEVEAWLAALGIVCSDEFEGTDADAADAAVEVFLSVLDAGGDAV